MAFMPKGFMLLSLCIQNVSLDSHQAKVSGDLGSHLISSRTLIRMSKAVSAIRIVGYFVGIDHCVSGINHNGGGIQQTV